MPLSQLKKWSGYALGVCIAFNVLVQQNVEATQLIPLVQVFMQASETKKSPMTDDESNGDSSGITPR